MTITKVNLSPKTHKTLNYLDSMTFPCDNLYPKEGRTWWLARDKEGPVGFAGLEKLNDHTAFICRIGVFQRCAGEGIGRKLLRVVENQARKEGYDTIVSYTLPDNYKSANNLIRCGYRLVKPTAWFGFRDALHFRKAI